MKVAVSIVAGADETMVLRCLETLFDTSRGSGLDLDVTVVENQTGRALVARLHERFPDLHVVENTGARGFAANHNSVLRRVTAPYALILNDDVEFLDDAVTAMVLFMQHPDQARVAVVSPKLLNSDRTLQPSTYAFPTLSRALLDVSGLRTWVPVSSRLFRLAHALGAGAGRSRYWAHDRTCDVDTLRGACVLVRLAAAREVGLMDETTIVGGEETEWHRRFREHGWRVVFLAEASVVHVGGQTVARNRLLRVEYFKGYLNYFRRHPGGIRYVTFAALALAVYGVRYALAVLRRARLERRESALGVRTAWRWLVAAEREAVGFPRMA